MLSLDQRRRWMCE